MKTRKLALSARQITEYQLKQITGRQHAIACGRGSAAIEAALRISGAAGRTVLIPANTCYAVLWAVLRAGATPHLVDCDPRTGNVSIETLERSGVDHPAAVIPCHLYGLPAPMRSISEWARTRDIFVIEDAALALGATVDDQPAGSWGDVSIFSFGTGKIVDVFGVGGAVLTHNPILAESMRAFLASLPVFTDSTQQLIEGWSDVYWALHRHEAVTPVLAELYPRLFELYGETLAFSLDPDEWRALPDALDHLPENLAHRAKLAAVYDSAFSHAITIERPRGAVLWKYPLLIDPARRHAVLDHLWAHDIHEATCWYPSLQRMHKALCPNANQPATPHADRWGDSIINLPLDPLTTADDAAQIAALVNAVL